MHMEISRAQITMSCPCAHHPSLGEFETWWETGGDASHELFT